MDPVFEEGVNLIQNDVVRYVIDYLKTGNFNQPNNKKFIEAYS